MLRLTIEGWRFLPHSFSIVNQFHCLELLRRPDLEIFHRDFPYFSPHWQPIKGLFSSTEEALLQGIPQPPEDSSPGDVTFRIAVPYSFTPASGDRTALFITSEWGFLEPDFVNLGAYPTLATAFADPRLLLITPSRWCQAGLLRCGADPDRLVVVPLGVEPQLYQPASLEVREQLRQSLGWSEEFIFLHIGAMTSNKAVDLLLKAFAVVVSQYPTARLVLKGVDALYNSADLLRTAAQILTPQEADRTLPRVTYLGQPLPFADMARLYQAADAYVSPYVAEGFNMPVLEAIACGLPVICTAGGATDDFTHPDFALRIQSRPQQVTFASGQVGTGLVPDYNHLVFLMQTAIAQPEIAQRARQTGPAFVNQGFTWSRVVDQLLIALNS